MCRAASALALLKTAQDNDTPVRIVEAVVQANDLRKRAMGRKIIAALGGDARGKKIALLGLTFKPNTDDMRDAPSIAIVQTLLDAGAEIYAHDPEGMAEAGKLLPEVKMTDSAYAAADGADAVALVTEWDAYRALDLARLRQSMKGDALIDLRNIYRPSEAEAAGFAYSSVGR
jgi:UDPglucose 6-dehydrogenase